MPPSHSGAEGPGGDAVAAGGPPGHSEVGSLAAPPVGDDLGRGAAGSRDAMDVLVAAAGVPDRGTVPDPDFELVGVLLEYGTLEALGRLLRDVRPS